MPRSRLGGQMLQSSQPPRSTNESCVRAPLRTAASRGVEGRTAADGRVDHRLHVPCPCSLVDESQPHVFRSGRHCEGIRQAVRPTFRTTEAYPVMSHSIALQTARGIYRGYRVTLPDRRSLRVSGCALLRGPARRKREFGGNALPCSFLPRSPWCGYLAVADGRGRAHA
jgi:hypothetical protein